ncbi:hypothetical protein K2Z83_08600 [Oscillochloris sp. ZM17-4]|uniref:hypothetical protein n=1 Tax=Oscillochloris sp. ZM17-4 TaxID=2866714 RepID=UPI001C72EA51|nr:hypothetical protein [Oscillochloris sp. ZM17-4]MBX0327734.1 hypothetical protein [Oscillochloris sp. ZM17-4]
MSTSELIAALAIAMVCNDIPCVNRTLRALDTRMAPEKMRELLVRLDQVRRPSARCARAHAA